MAEFTSQAPFIANSTSNSSIRLWKSL